MSEDSDWRLRESVGGYGREPDRHIIYLNMDEAQEGDIAHELMHGILRLEGYPHTAHRHGDVDAAFWGSHIGSPVVHIELEKRLQRLGFDTEYRNKRKGSGRVDYVIALRREQGEEGIRQIHLDALSCLEAQFRHGKLGRQFLDLLRRNLPEACSLGKELVDIVKQNGFRSPQQCRKSLVAIIKQLDTSIRNSDLRYWLVQRIFVLPVWLSPQKLPKLAMDIFEIDEFPNVRSGFAVYGVRLKDDGSFIQTFDQE